LNGIPVYWVRCAPVTVLEARERADRSPMFQGLALGMSKDAGWYASF